MKICLIVGAFPKMKCGIGDYTHRLAEELAKDGNEVHIITSKRADVNSETLKIHNIMDKWGFSELKLIINKIKEISPDIVNIQYPSNEFVNNYMVAFLPLQIKRKIKCKIIVTIHEYVCLYLKTRIKYYLTFSKADKIIVAEEEFIDLIKKDFKDLNIEYVPISSNIPRSQITPEKKEELLEKYGLKNQKVITYFGFVVLSKGLEYLFECVSKLNNVKILFIGELKEEVEYHKSLKKLIEKLKIKDKVVITGFFEDEKDVADLLKISDVCVLPFTEGVKKRNGSFLAAYNQEIPVVTTSKNNKDIDGNGIYYAKPNNEEELLEKINKALDDKKEIKRDELTWKKVAESYKKSFNEVMKNGGKNYKK